MDRIDRIREMEQRMDRAARWIRSVSSALEERASIESDMYELASYYESAQWMEDYEADESGLLPDGLKRGVLSEDGLYSLLAEYEELLAELGKLGRGSAERRNGRL